MLTYQDLVNRRYKFLEVYNLTGSKKALRIYYYLRGICESIIKANGMKAPSPGMWIARSTFANAPDFNWREDNNGSFICTNCDVFCCTDTSTRLAWDHVKYCKPRATASIHSVPKTHTTSPANPAKLHIEPLAQDTQYTLTARLIEFWNEPSADSYDAYLKDLINRPWRSSYDFSSGTDHTLSPNFTR